jgi:hypothetical protein
MDPASLLETLRSLEMALHQPEVRRDRGRLMALLHARYREFGRSGRIYDRPQILEEFSGQPQTYKVWSQEYRVESLGESVALLTYKSAHIGDGGSLERHANRSSLWLHTENGWQMLFHQGTPTEPFPRQAT